jgi:predicted Zn-dependent peptidase
VTVKGGSRSETAATQGGAAYLKLMPRLATAKRTSFGVAMGLEETPVSLSVCVGREAVSYVAQTPSSELASAADLIAEITLHPRYADHEVHDLLELYLDEVAHPCAQKQANDLLMETAFGPSAISNSAIPRSYGSGLTADAMKKLHASTVSAKNVVISAYGVDHKDFVAAVSKSFTSIPSSSSSTSSSSASAYYGGDSRIRTSSEKVNIALGFSAPSNSAAAKDIAAMRVAVAALGGGSTSYRDHMGPGKGLRSLLYKSVVLPHSKVVYWCNTAYESFSDAGLLRIHARLRAGNSAAYLSAVSAALKSLASTPLSSSELQRSINTARFAYHAGVETATDKAKHAAKATIGAAVNLTDSDFAAVTADDVRRVVAAALASPASLSAVGNTIDVPSVKSLVF